MKEINTVHWSAAAVHVDTVTLLCGLLNGIADGESAAGAHESGRLEFRPRLLERVGEHLLPGDGSLRVLLDEDSQVRRRELVAVGAVPQVAGRRVALLGEDLPILIAEAEEVGFQVHGSITPDSVMSCQHLSVLAPASNSRMNDDALIRLENLKALNLTAQQLSERVGGRVSYWSDLMRGKKSFGEKAARNIEEKLGMPRGYMDAADEEAPIFAVPKQEPGAQPDVMRAIAVLAGALSTLDKATRLAVAPLLSLLAQEPEQLESVSSA
jgi:transcriptional regulator with XRE-family HTH domain